MKILSRCRSSTHDAVVNPVGTICAAASSWHEVSDFGPWVPQAAPRYKSARPGEPAARIFSIFASDKPLTFFRSRAGAHATL